MCSQSFWRCNENINTVRLIIIGQQKYVFYYCTLQGNKNRKPPVHIQKNSTGTILIKQKGRDKIFYSNETTFSLKYMAEENKYKSL